MLADRIIVTTDGDHTSVEVIVGLIHTYRRDMLCLNNSVMDTIIICPEDGDLKLGKVEGDSCIIFM